VSLNKLKQTLGFVELWFLQAKYLSYYSIICHVTRKSQSKGSVPEEVKEQNRQTQFYQQSRH